MDRVINSARFRIVALLGGVLIAGVAGADFNLPEVPRGKGDQCVEPTEIMRKDHMEFLNHQRDLTVYNGIRGNRHSLIGCVQCHTRRDDHGRFIPIDAPGQFCESCHQFTGVQLDCFECHATKPDAEFTHAQ